MFGSKKQEPVPEENGPFVSRPKGYNPAKGAPTPRRKDVEAQRRRPLVADRTALTKDEKKKRKAEDRARSNELYQTQQQAMRTGDERNMPHQHRGKVRRWGRDFIDAASPLAGYFMPLALLLLPTIFLQARFPDFMQWVTLGIYIIFFVMFIQAIFVVRRCKLLATHHFGSDEVPSGFTMQMFGRAFYLRNWRLPKPQVKRGEYPEGATRADLAEAKAAKKAKGK